MMQRIRRLLPSMAALGLLFGGAAFATDQPTHEPTLAQKLRIERANRWLSAQEGERRDEPKIVITRPYAEFETGRFLLISASSGFGSDVATTKMARNLPSGVKLVVLASNSIEQSNAQATYGRYLDQTRLSVVNLGTRMNLWARDSLPIPVWSKEGGLALVDARYYHGNEPDGMLAQVFRLPLVRHSYYFEGGNLMNDDEGNCFIVAKSDVGAISDDAFRRFYGCQELTRLPHVAGIGHVDERLKVLSGRRMVTDESSYVAKLERLGYTVTRLPRPRTSMGTYANALLLNGTIFLPTYGESTDAEAERIYADLGFRVVPLPSSALSSQGKGSIHCITMVYPTGSEAELIARLR